LVAPFEDVLQQVGVIQRSLCFYHAASSLHSCRGQVAMRQASLGLGLLTSDCEREHAEKSAINLGALALQLAALWVAARWARVPGSGRSLTGAGARE
jgi:hypothetical protein